MSRLLIGRFCSRTPAVSGAVHRGSDPEGPVAGVSPDLGQSSEA